MRKIFSAVRNVWEKNWPEMHAAFTGGIPHFVFSSKPKSINSNIPVFCYHVPNEQELNADLRFLFDNGYTTIDADTLLKHLNGTQKAPHKSIVITFDDGAQQLYTIAYPLLKKYKMKAVVFIAPRFHQFEADIPDDGLLRPLCWEKIIEMEKTGVFDFQSHTMEHRYIPRWPEFIELAAAHPQVAASLLNEPLSMRDDFLLARQTLEQRLGKQVRHLAFPKFFGTEEAIGIGRECGYEAFWWGSLPGKPDNRFCGLPAYIVRLEGQFTRRLPGQGRVSLSFVLGKRYLGSLIRLTNKFKRVKI